MGQATQNPDDSCSHTNPKRKRGRRHMLPSYASVCKRHGAAYEEQWSILRQNVGARDDRILDGYLYGGPVLGGGEDFKPVRQCEKRVGGNGWADRWMIEQGGLWLNEIVRLR